MYLTDPFSKSPVTRVKQAVLVIPVSLAFCVCRLSAVGSSPGGHIESRRRDLFLVPLFERTLFGTIYKTVLILVCFVKIVKQQKINISHWKIKRKSTCILCIPVPAKSLLPSTGHTARRRRFYWVFFCIKALNAMSLRTILFSTSRK